MAIIPFSDFPAKYDWLADQLRRLSMETSMFVPFYLSSQYGHGRMARSSGRLQLASDGTKVSIPIDMTFSV